MKNIILLNRCGTALVLLALAIGCTFLGAGWPQSASARTQSDAPNQVVEFGYSNSFGMIPAQLARFCVGTTDPRGPTLGWTVRISDARGNPLFELPETLSSAGEWRCRDVAREMLNVPGDAVTGRVEVAALVVVKAPRGTAESDIIGSVAVHEATGTTAYLVFKFEKAFITPISPSL